jgi:ribosomal protein L40E
MPCFETLEAYARRVEAEMPLTAKSLDTENSPRKKICPVCHAESDLALMKCDDCGSQFRNSRQNQVKTCAECASLNPTPAASCLSCGAAFRTSFVLKLEEALRTGAIVRGMDLREDEVQLGEEMAAPVRERILVSGDVQLVRLLKILPEESFARLKAILGRP